MFKKIILIGFTFLNSITFVQAQKDSQSGPGSIKPSFQKLLLELATTYFTVLKENQVDLDSSLIHVSKSFLLSRLPLVTEGISDQGVLNNAWWVNARKPEFGEKQLKLASGAKHATIQILLGAYFAFEPGNDSAAFIRSETYLLNGINECEQLGDKKLKLAAERLLGKLYLKAGNFSRADKLFVLAVKGYTDAGETAAAALTYSWWGLYMPVTATSTLPRIAHTDKAIKLYNAAGDNEGQINALMNACYLDMLLYDMPGSVELAKRAFILSENSHFPYAHYITGALMSVTMFQGKFGEPLTYGIQSVQSAEQTKDRLMLPYFYGVVADLYGNEDDRDEIIINWEKKSINSFLEQHEPCYMALCSIIPALIRQNHKKEALAFIENVSRRVPPVTMLDKFFYQLALGMYAASSGKYGEAHQHFQQTAVIENKLEQKGLSVRKPTVLESLAELYFLEKNLKQASFYYHQYLSQPAIVKGGFLSNKINAYKKLIAIDSTAGDEKAQLKDHRLLMDASLKNYTVSKTRLAEELQVKYATAAKINQIKLLNQKAALEQENLKQANRAKNITIAGIVMLLIIAVLLYRQGANRKRNNQLITLKNEAMQRLLDEKEWLVKEIHHRVKNNLHTVICLLESQAMYLENDALQAVENSRHRIYAMSLIHQKLYQSEDIRVVDMKTYLADFVVYLQESFGSPENISVNLAAASVKLGAGQAIPVGLIVNEAVTNAFKYAFPNQRDGEISITLQKSADKIHLTITDNGIGFEQSGQETTSLGLDLINGLTLDLRGDIVIDSSHGTSIRIIFEIDQVNAPAPHEQVLT